MNEEQDMSMRMECLKVVTSFMLTDIPVDQVMGFAKTAYEWITKQDTPNAAQLGAEVRRLGLQGK